MTSWSSASWVLSGGREGLGERHLYWEALGFCVRAAGVASTEIKGKLWTLRSSPCLGRGLEAREPGRTLGNINSKAGQREAVAKEAEKQALIGPRRRAVWRAQEGTS